MVELTQFVITGLTVGMVYSLVALGFVLVWKSSGVANLALGQLVLIFSWFTYSMLVQVGLPVWLGFSLVVLLSKMSCLVSTSIKYVSRLWCPHPGKSDVVSTVPIS
jgi:branched-subunit amino acid ABC-type transport system permease component